MTIAILPPSNYLDQVERIINKIRRTKSVTTAQEFAAIDEPLRQLRAALKHEGQSC